MGVVGRRQAEGVGEDKRLVVQPRRVVIIDGEGEKVVELLGGNCERKLGVGAHALTQNVRYFKWQERRRDY
jgi:hypothetical protein